MNVIHVTKPAERKCYRVLDAAVTIIKYRKSTINHAIYIKVFNYGTVSYIIVSTDDVIDTTNNETLFPELTSVFKEQFEMKVQEGSVLQYLNFRICQSLFGFSVYQTDHILGLVNECFLTGKFRKTDTPFRGKSAYEK